MQNVILSGGIYHPFAECAGWMAQQLPQATPRITEDVAEAIQSLEPADLFTLYALRWRMLNDPKYQPFIDEWAFSMPEELAGQLDAHVHAGGAMLAMHTASICFDTWPGFSRLLGGHWEWGTTFHPPLGAIEVQPIGDHAIVRGLENFRLNDEVYHHLAIQPDSEPLLRARTPDGDWHTVAWARHHGAGKVVYSALGHSVDSLAVATHTQFLGNALRWLTT